MKIKIHKDYLAFVLIVWEQLAPVYIRQFIIRSALINYIFTLVSFSVCIWFVINRPVKVKPLLYLILFPFAILIFSTYQNKGDLFQATVLLLRIAMNCMLVDALSENSYKLNCFLHVVRDITLLYFTINIITILILPNGIESYENANFYLYGNPNTMIRYVVPGLCCSSLIDVRKEKKLSAVTLFFFMGLYFTYAFTYFSVTSFMGTLFICIWIILKDMIRSKIRVTRLAYYGVLTFVLLFEVYVVLSVGGNDYAVLLNDFFGKTDIGGVVSRRNLWVNAVISFMQKPIMGWGLLENQTLLTMIGNASGAHNYFLDMAYQRGSLGLGAFIAVIVYSLYRVTKNKTISDMGFVLMGYCCMCFIMFLAEPFTTTEPLFIPIIYMFISKGLKDEKVVRKCKF